MSRQYDKYDIKIWFDVLYNSYQIIKKMLWTKFRFYYTIFNTSLCLTKYVIECQLFTVIYNFTVSTRITSNKTKGQNAMSYWKDDKNQNQNTPYTR